MWHIEQRQGLRELTALQFTRHHLQASHSAHHLANTKRSASRPLPDRPITNLRPLIPHTQLPFNPSTMADQVQEMLDVPREFLKDGVQFINRAQKRTYFRCRVVSNERPVTNSPGPNSRPPRIHQDLPSRRRRFPRYASPSLSAPFIHRPTSHTNNQPPPTVMGAVGYFVKLSTSSLILPRHRGQPSPSAPNNQPELTSPSSSPRPAQQHPRRRRINAPPLTTIHTTDDMTLSYK